MMSRSSTRYEPIPLQRLNRFNSELNQCSLKINAQICVLFMREIYVFAVCV